MTVVCYDMQLMLATGTLFPTHERCDSNSSSDIYFINGISENIHNNKNVF